MGAAVTDVALSVTECDIDDGFEHERVSDAEPRFVTVSEAVAEGRLMDTDAEAESEPLTVGLSVIEWDAPDNDSVNDRDCVLDGECVVVRDDDPVRVRALRELV